ncbi:MAG: hypothetical protein ACRD8O_11965, partial [Bryobacteraceae bacterium]
MIDFATTTPFELIRRIAAAGHGNPSLYLLVSDAAEIEAVQADIAAEVQVQLGVDVRSLKASEVQPEKLDEAFRPEGEASVVLITLERWTPRLIVSLDGNIVLAS